MSGLSPAERAAAEAAPGFLPGDEAAALHEAALAAPPGPLLEVGTYAGRSAVWLGAAARARGGVLVTVDHHRGSEEHQPGWAYHDPDLVDPVVGRIDTLPAFRRTIAAAGLEDVVVAMIGPSAVVAALWSTPLSLVFVDGGHTDAAAQADYEGWAPHLLTGGVLAVHDVFADPAEGGQAPWRLWQRARASGAFADAGGCGSLRLLVRRDVGDPLRAPTGQQAPSR